MTAILHATELAHYASTAAFVGLAVTLILGCFIIRFTPARRRASRLAAGPTRRRLSSPLPDPRNGAFVEELNAPRHPTAHSIRLFRDQGSEFTRCFARAGRPRRNGNGPAIGRHWHGGSNPTSHGENEMLYQVRLELAHCREFPNGNTACGYDLMLPLTSDRPAGLQSMAATPARQQCLPLFAQGGVAWRIEARSPWLVLRLRIWRGTRRSGPPT